MIYFTADSQSSQSKFCQQKRANINLETVFFQGQHNNKIGDNLAIKQIRGGVFDGVP